MILVHREPTDMLCDIGTDKNSGANFLSKSKKLMLMSTKIYIVHKCET